MTMCAGLVAHLAQVHLQNVDARSGERRHAVGPQSSGKIGSHSTKD